MGPEVEVEEKEDGGADLGFVEAEVDRERDRDWVGWRVREVEGAGRGGRRRARRVRRKITTVERERKERW